MNSKKKAISGRRMAMMVLAVMCGMIAAWATHRYIQDRVRQFEADARVPTVAYVVAAYDLDAGLSLSAPYVAVRNIPVQWISQAMLTPEAFAALENPVLSHSLKQGEAILIHDIAPVHESALSERVATGRRAITIAVDDVSAMTGILHPGDLIDLYVSFDHLGKPVTAALLQKVKVLALGGEDDPKQLSSGSSNLTLDAIPADAAKLVAARQAGKLTAVLRHRHDDRTDAVRVSGDLAQLVGLKPPRIRSRAPDIPILYGDDADGAQAAHGDSGGVKMQEAFADLIQSGRMEAMH